MNSHLQQILTIIDGHDTLSEAQKNAIAKLVKDANKELEITVFKLDRTDKVKRTTAILLEETIGELEQKRKAVEAQNQQIQDEKSRAEEALRELQVTQKQLIQSEKMASLGELTAGIAHEIQNPLNFVNNFSEVSRELLQEMKTAMDQGDRQEAAGIADDVIGNLEKILHHGKRADGIVKGMLQHSSAGNGKKEPGDINALAEEYLRLAYHGLRAKDKAFNATLETKYDVGIQLIPMIPQDIGRVLLNLMVNAFYAVNERRISSAREYRPLVTLSTQLENRAGRGFAVVSIRDNGTGIPKKIIDKIFQPFFTTKPTGQGTGLGLSLAYDIIKAHGGELDVLSTEEERTEFIMRLPVK